MNNSLTRLYSSHGHSSVIATVTSVQGDNNETTVMRSPPDTQNDVEKATSIPCSPNHVHEESGIQSIKELAESVVCY